MLCGTWRTAGSRATPHCASARHRLHFSFPGQKRLSHTHRQRHPLQRHTFDPEAVDSALDSGQDMQSDMAAERSLNGEGDNERVKGRTQSAAARACSQAVDGLDKLLSTDERKSQPLRHRSKALRALDLAGMPCAPSDVSHVCLGVCLTVFTQCSSGCCLRQWQPCLQAVPTCC